MRYLLIDVERSSPEVIKLLMQLSPYILNEEETLAKFKETWDNAILSTNTNSVIPESHRVLGWDEYIKHL